MGGISATGDHNGLDVRAAAIAAMWQQQFLFFAARGRDVSADVTDRNHHRSDLPQCRDSEGTESASRGNRDGMGI